MPITCDIRDFVPLVSVIMWTLLFRLLVCSVFERALHETNLVDWHPHARFKACACKCHAAGMPLNSKVIEMLCPGASVAACSDLQSMCCLGRPCTDHASFLCQYLCNCSLA